jgi:hypothetical protein
MRTNKGRRHVKILLAAAVLLLLLAAMAACAPAKQAVRDAVPSNDTVVVGTLDIYSPADKSSHDSGEAMDRDEEAALQQDRIAGGATGTVTSKNLPALDAGITAPSAGAYVQADPVGEPVPMVHELEGREDCLLCHKSGGSGAQMPKSHYDSKLTSTLCQSCHKAA